MPTKKEDLVILVNLEDCVTSIKQRRPKIGVHGYVLGHYNYNIPEKLFNPLSHNLFEGSLLIDTCDLKDTSPYSLGTKEWTGVIERGVFENLNPDRVLRHMDRFNRADTLYDVDLYDLHKRYAVNLIKKGDLYYKLDADAPYTGPLYQVGWDYVDYAERGKRLKEQLKEIKIEKKLGERIEILEAGYWTPHCEFPEIFKLAVVKVGEFKNGKLEGSFKEYWREVRDFAIKYLSTEYTYAQGLLHGATFQWEMGEGYVHFLLNKVDYKFGLKDGLDRSFWAEGNPHSSEIKLKITSLGKYKKGEEIQCIYDDEVLRKMFPNGFNPDGSEK